MTHWYSIFQVIAADILRDLKKMDTYDEDAYSGIHDFLATLSDIEDAPPAYYSKIRRLQNLSTMIMQGATDFTGGVSKLIKGITQLRDDFSSSEEEPQREEPSSSTQEGLPDAEADSGEVQSYFKEQESSLNAFLQNALNCTTRDSDTAEQLILQLKKWNKDFESLGLYEYAAVVFAVLNEFMDNPDFNNETLFRLHTLLNGKSRQVSEGIIPAITDSEVGALFDPPADNSGAAEDIHGADGSGTEDFREDVSDESSSEYTTITIPRENEDLITQFVQNQKDVLDTFESYIYEYETNGDRLDSIKGLIHTWKGEFGVLGLGFFSDLLHKIEDTFEQAGQVYSPDTLYRLNDFLRLINRRLAENDEAIRVYENEYNSLFTAAENDIADAPGRTEESSQNSPTGGETFPVEGDEDLLLGFVQESREHLDLAEGEILEIEKGSGDSELLDSVFRCYHTIKGVAGFLHFDPVKEMAHTLEDVMSMARDKSIPCNEAFIDLMLDGTTGLKQIISSIETGLNTGSYSLPNTYADILQRADSIKQGDALPAGSDDAPSRPESSEKDRPAVPVKEEQTAVVPDKSSSIEPAELKKTATPQPSFETNGRAPDSKPAASPGGRSKKRAVSETIRVPVDKLDMLIASIGEAVIAQSMIHADEAVSSISNQHLSRKMTHADQIMRQVQELSMSLRMVSIKPTFQKMARLVRELSRKFEKPVDFIMEGEDTEIDKSIVESIGDPLIHMVRNSLDHGVESPRERREAGKNEKGKVILRAFHKSGSIFIEIEDDGKGLDSDALMKKAVKNGICSKDEVLSEKECFNLIFAPGFSTSETITDVSGRGVGMDVVKR
ncbi:MAG: Hpt domain-containing protein, partial [Fibrobacterota bacterium]